MKHFSFLFVVFTLFSITLLAQDLKPGFDPSEFIEVLHMSGTKVDSIKRANKTPQQGHYHLAYTSPVVGLDNCWHLWLKDDNKTMLINLRGTTGTLTSWLENFYAAMIPATGTLKISDSNVFDYKFAADPKAMVHVGWAVGVGSLMPTIEQKIHEYYARGVRQIIITGHSQGAGLAFLLRSYIYYQQQANMLPRDLVIKTYCSAAPKPGNQYYAYDYEFITRDGWGYTIVNAADWVPEVPFAVQTVNDFNVLNPFTNARKLLRKQKKFFVRLFLLHAFNQLDKPTRKAQRHFEKYLGRAAGKMTKKYMPGYQPPAYTNSNNFVRAGSPVILQPDDDYYNHFTNNTTNIFMHHHHNAYFYLMKKIYGVE